MMRLILLTLLVFQVALGISVSKRDKDWTLWKRNHGKKYEDDKEELQRRLIWEQNHDKINLHNLGHSMGIQTFTMSMNIFGDMRHDEFIESKALFQPIENMKFGKQPRKPNLYAELPDSIDWREKGYVTAVKDQGQCGSSEVFSITGVMEGQYMAKSGTLVSFSEQQLMDCAGKSGSSFAGWPLDYNSLYDYIKKYGIEKESDYPSGNPGKCKYDASKVVTKISGYVEIPPSEDDLQNATATVGPIAVVVDASHSSFQFYASGVYSEANCSSQLVDHAVLVVGYGNQDGQDFWLVKNSWGSSWGENGYIKMARNRNNQCGIASFASYPII